MKIRVALILSFFLFFSSVNANNGAFTKDTQSSTVVESKVSVEQISDDFEASLDFTPSFTIFLPIAPDVTQVHLTNAIAYYIYKPPKSSSFIS